MTAEENVQAREFEALLEEAKGEGHAHEGAHHGQEDDHKEIDLFQASLNNDGSVTVVLTSINKRLLEKVLSKPDGQSRDRLVAEVKEDREQRLILGCLTGSLSLEIQEFGSKKVASETGEFLLIRMDNNNTAFMQYDPDQHFNIRPLHDFCPLESTPSYRQRYSFRFPKLGLVQVSCQIYYIIHMDEEGHLGRLVRVNIQGSIQEGDNDGWLFSTSNSHGPWHPVEKILDLFSKIDIVVVRRYLIACVKYLQRIESEIKDNASPESLRNATMSLLYLNTNLSRLRTTLRYLHTSVAVLKLNTPELEIPRHQDLLLKDLQPRQAERLWGIYDSHPSIPAARPDRTNLRKQIEEEFKKANWYNSGLAYRLEQLDMVLVHRLLDVETAEQRIQISLSVVSNLLAQQDNEWNRNMADSQTVMARSQKTIALITMFFLPATFFAILFTLPLFNWDDPTEPVIRPKMWIYWIFTTCFTVLLFLCYFIWDFVSKLVRLISSRL